jgi:hypothetical protein
MAKYNQPPDYDKCPKCKEGRLKVEIFKDGFVGDTLILVCTNRETVGCDFNEWLECED